MKRLCIYHSADHDGLCSAAIVKRQYPNIELHGWDYGEPIPWRKIEIADEVIMVDISFQPYSEMIALSKVTRLIWIDHHSSAIKLGKENPINCVAVFDEDKAACKLTWEYYFPEEEMPYGVKLLGDYDEWNHQDPNCEPFEYGMRISYTDPEDTEHWNAIFDNPWCGGPEDGDYYINHIVNSGGTILEYLKQTYEYLAKQYAYEKEIDGLLFLVANNPHRTSKYFDSIYDEKRYDGVISYYWTGKFWRVSLYSDKKDVDVSKVATKYGGGGHKNAAGFQTQDINWLTKGNGQWAQHKLKQ